MNPRKLNISRWYPLGFAAVLVIACLVLATGTAWARYRSENESNINFKPRAPVTLYLGKTDTETGEFSTAGSGAWEMVEGQLQLDFAVANGTDGESFEETTQIFRVRLIGSLGVRADDETFTIVLTDPQAQSADQSEETAVQYAAQPVRINENSPLYSDFGDGWVYYFLDEEGKELTWTLKGGQLSCVDLDLTVVSENSLQIDTSLLQLQVLGEIAEP